MRRTTIALQLVAAGLALASIALATPVPNSAVLHTRVFDDCPISTLSTTNTFPGLIQISDQNTMPPFCAGFANLHTWRFSTDGVNAIQFLNGDAFEYSCTFVLNGIGEGGLNLSPWWGPESDGLFNVRTTDGEIACFGGRMPFFSFTGAFGLVYINNTPIQLGITYLPNGLSAASPAQVIYNVRYNSINYTSGLLNFDQGNPAEDPPHGQWGALTPWYAGGHVKMFAFPAGLPHGIVATWSDIHFTGQSTPPVIHCPADVALECGDSSDPSNTGTATASGGNCPGGETFSHTDAATAANCTGQAGIDRTWTATDDCGHSVSCIQHITFVDNTGPTILATGTPADGQLGCNPTAAEIEAALGTASANDNCGGTPTPSPTDGGVVSDGCARSQTRTWNASDACGNPATQVSRTAKWTVDAQGPTISAVSASPATLWPPNHKMRDVTVDYTVTGNCASGVTTTLSVTSNEPINGTGDGDTAPDWEIVDNHHVRLRAERSGNGSGRIYTITVNATGGCGNASSQTVSVVVAHDPAGYTTGGGWYASPAGAYRAKPAVSGKVSYGFTSKYFMNATNPNGATQFEFKLAGLKFNALTFDYLAIAGAKAQLKGFGKLNGNASYNFILTVIDGQLLRGGGADRIRMKIWNKTTGVVAYDSQPGASDEADPTTAVGAGSSIVIATTNRASTATASAAGDEGDESARAIEPARVRTFSLNASRPNPFHSRTELQYTLPERARVDLSVYDVRGARVKVLVDGIEEAGDRFARFEAGRLEAGVYFVRLQATSVNDPTRQFTQVRKMLMLK